MEVPREEGSGPGEPGAIAGPRPGTEFAGHRIEAEVGRGGMGVVHRARHLALDRIRALKVISPDLSGDPGYAERFRRECRLAASVEHPAVVTVHHAGEEGGLLYMSMQFVDGVDLARLLADGPLRPARAVGILAQLAAGLDAAHETGLIHRDVKPENVLVAADERAYLTDFGIGTVAEASDRAQTRLTGRGIVLGTSDYMAPEQIAGEAVDRRADVYSLACVSFHMLTGRPPFAGLSELAKLSAHGSAARPRASEADPTLGTEVDAALARGMAVDPEDRPATATALVGDLERSLRAGAQAPTRPLSGAPHARRRLPAVGIGLAATAAVAAALILLTGREDQGSPRQSASVAQLEAPREPVAVAAGSDRIWVAGRESDRVIPLGANGERPLGRGLELESPRALALGFGYLWAVGRDGLTRIDLASGRPSARLPLEDPSDVAVDHRHVWALERGAQPRAIQVDPASVKPTGQGFVGSDPRSLAAGAGSIWVTNTADGTVSEIDPGTARVVGSPIDVGGRPTNLAAAAGAVWVLDNFGGRLVPIDPDGAGGSPATGDPIETAPRPRGIAIGFGSIWVSSGEDGTVARFGTDGGGPEAVYSVGDDPADLDIGQGSVWSADQGSAAVSRIDPGRG